MRERPTTPVQRTPIDGERRLKLRRGSEEWTLTRLRPSLSIGRDPDNDVVVDSEYVSRRHAAVEYTDGEIRLRDTSSNGTFIVAADGTVVEACRTTHVLRGEGQITLGRRPGISLTFVAQTFASATGEWELWKDPGAGTGEVPAGVAVFRREGDYWTLQFEGAAVRLKDAKGLHFLGHLLRHPGQEFHALDLASVDATPAPAAGGGAREVLARGHVADAGSPGSALDATAKSAYRERLHELRDELDEAQRFNDTGRAERAQAEIEALATQLAEAVGLGGRDRPTASNAERARVMVTHRIRATLKKIKEGHPALGAHLGNAVKTGTFCVYEPEPGRTIDWTF